jgi:hypothetical protein
MKPSREDPTNPVPDEAQFVFDTVTGPNLRLKDNLIQLAVIIVGTLLGAGIGAGWAYRQGSAPLGGLIVGGFIGVVASLLGSGAVLGLIRFATAFRRH